MEASRNQVVEFTALKNKRIQHNSPKTIFLLLALKSFYWTTFWSYSAKDVIVTVDSVFCGLASWFNNANSIALKWRQKKIFDTNFSKHSKAWIEIEPKISVVGTFAPLQNTQPSDICLSWALMVSSNRKCWDRGTSTSESFVFALIWRRAVQTCHIGSLRNRRVLHCKMQLPLGECLLCDVFTGCY